ncbi:MAG TPA: hypothetical protein VGR57_06620 [Ktedonobacterales bacterium]|nr:hypothetical protein [Ktedonobacterales bacterium]
MGKPIPQRPLEARLNAVTPARPAARAARKVPEIILAFWVAKLLTTALGEATSDYLVYHYDKYKAVEAGFVALVIALGLQLLVRRYIAWVYWLAVLMVAVFGTMAADVVHLVLLVPYLNSTIGFAIALAVIFGVWYLSERTLSIHSIYTPRRELFYWATVMTTFALGTAAGDMTAYTLRLGFLDSAILFAVVIAIPAVAWRFAHLNPIVAFWFAYIVTRPLGASFADWFGKARDVSGLGYGDGPVVAVLLALLVAVVAYLAITRADVKPEGAHPAPLGR